MNHVRMSRFTLSRAAVALMLVVFAAGCRDQLPTVAGAERFPQGTLLQSETLDLTANVELLGRHGGFSSPAMVGYGLVAANFGGSLQARTLLRFAAFPDTVFVPGTGGATPDTAFTYTGGQMVARVDTAAAAATGPLTLRLVALAQAWDAPTATWTLASGADGGTAWQQPGGTLGRELARATWAPRDTLFGDSIRFEVDSLGVAQMAQPGFHGVAIVAEGGPARLQLGDIVLRARVRPGARPDTVLTVFPAVVARTFVFTPSPPAFGGDWVAGGIEAVRTLFRVTLPDSVSACPPGIPQGPTCPRRALRDVALNEVALLLRPQPVGGGFRPLAPVTLRLRSVAEPELGERAPLGPVISGQPGLFAQVTVQPNLFAAPADTTISLRITQHVQEVFIRQGGTGTVSTSLALLAEPEGARFGQVRFAAAPRLRLVYTLPVQRTAP